MLFLIDLCWWFGKVGERKNPKNYTMCLYPLILRVNATIMFKEFYDRCYFECFITFSSTIDQPSLLRRAVFLWFWTTSRPATALYGDGMLVVCWRVLQWAQASFCPLCVLCGLVPHLWVVGWTCLTCVMPVCSLILALVLQVLTVVSFHICFGVSVLFVVRRGARAASLLFGAHQPKQK